MKRPSAWTALGLILLAFAGCASNGESTRGASDAARPAGTSESGGGLWDMLRRSRADKENAVKSREALDQRLDAGRSTVSKDWQVKMYGWWLEFLNRDPNWVASRLEWQALGPQAGDILVENLLLVLVRAYDIGNGVMYREAASNLYESSDRSTPYLVTCLAGNYGDDVIRSHCVDLLGRIGSPTLAVIEKAYSSADAAGRFNLIRACSRMSTVDTTPFFVRVIEDEDDFKLRITAIEGLGKSADPKGTATLIKCLGDDDISVRKFAAGYIGATGDRAAVRPLIECMVAAEAKRNSGNREGDVVVNCQSSLKYLTGENWRSGREWDAWWRRTNGK